MSPTARRKRNPKSYGQFCPVAKAAEVFAERWTPLVLRELLCGSHRFSEIQRGVPLMSPSLLTRRLRELEQAGLVEKRRAGGRGSHYHLTDAGFELQPVIMQLGQWGHRWAQAKVTRDELDPGLLFWDIRRRVDPSKAPDGQSVTEFVVRGVPRNQRRWWLVFEAGQSVDLCVVHPGFQVDLRVESDIKTLVDVWMGVVPLRAALRAGDLRLEGPRPLVRGFGQWFSLSVFAPG